MKIAILIPTRMESQRFPRKPLAPLKGVNGEQKSLIMRCWEAAHSANIPNASVAVVTDSDEIAAHVTKNGGSVIRTDKAQNGTDRCAQAATQVEADLIINFQGDAPLIPSDFVTAIVDYAIANPIASMVTPVMPCDRAMLDLLRRERREGRVGGTTAVLSHSDRALYFSKEILPISDQLLQAPEQVLLHVGLYAYRPETLRQYTNWNAGALEEIEGLEQLRFLENDIAVHCVRVKANGRAFWEVNNPEDVPVVEAALAKRGIK